MSLLMKALEKAAKDRGEARPEQAPAPAPAAAATAAAGSPPSASSSARSELSLEPMAGASPAPSRSEPRPAGAAPSRPSAPAPAAPPPAHEQAQAATLLQATAGSAAAGGGVGAYVRAHPVVVLGTVAGLFALGFGGYVYVQIFHPGLLTGRPPIAPKGVVPPQAQAPIAPAPGAAAPGEPIPSASVLKEPSTETGSPAPTAAAPRAKPEPRLPAAPPAEDPARGNTIVVSRGSPEPVLNPLLNEAYAALQANQLDAARGLYQKLLATEPRNIDALLALASIAARQGNEPEATRFYLRILELAPRHALAQSGLIALLGRADPVAAESRLRQLIAREPAPYLYFTLGNLYADQSQWAAAQQAYFQAHHLDPANPDYAYNLAVGLEHVSQPKLALGFCGIL